MKGRSFSLRCLFHLTKHFRRTSEIEAAIRLKFTQGCQHIMSAVNVCIHRRESVGKTLCDETLGGEVIALVEFMTAHDVKDTRIAFQAGRMQRESVHQMCDAAKPALRILQRHAAHKS